MEGLGQPDDAYLRGERPGKTGRGFENIVSFFSAEARDAELRPVGIKVSSVQASTPGCDLQVDHEDPTLTPPRTVAMQWEAR